jgi:hypothetical protein
MPKFDSRRRYLSLLTIIVVAICAFLVVVVQNAQLASEAERNLHATIYTCTIIDKLIVREKRWPTSWKDLVSSLSELDRTELPMQMSMSDIENRVFVRFDVTLEDVASKSNADELIRPIGVCYPSYRNKVLLVVETARRICSTSATSTE